MPAPALAPPAKKSAPALRISKPSKAGLPPKTSAPRVSPPVAAPAPPAMRLTGGEPLAPPMRKRMESSFGADLRAVRVHRGSGAAQAAHRLGAKAFAFGSNVVLGSRARADDLGVMAHETAHTIQQGSAPSLQRYSFGAGDPHESEAHHASQAVVSGQQFTVAGRTSGPRVQRLGLSDALDYFADKANNIPGFRMFTIVLGVNPVNMSSVPRTPANIIRALIEFLPGGGLITEALDNHGIIEKVGSWVAQQLDSLGMVGGAIKAAIMEFLDSLSWSDIFDLGGVWDRAKRIFTEPIDQIITFASGLVDGIITFIKDTILRPIAKLAEGTEGYNLLKGVMGEDPITGDPVPRSAETLLGPFMKIIGQGEIWENMVKSNAIPRCWAWFQSVLSELMGFVQQIPGLFVTAFQSLELMDIILVPRAFAKLAAVFGGFLGQFISWGANAIWSLLEIIFAVVAPGVMPYIAKARAALKTILKNPIGFVGNLVRAGKMGFQSFAANIGKHLKDALIKWITGPLGEAGVYIPKSFELLEIVKLVLSVLGLTWQNIRTKLLTIIPEPVLVILEKTAKILVTLAKDGPAAAWEEIKAELNELKGQLIAQVTQMVTTEVVKAAVGKIVSMLNPAGAFVQAILAVYNTVTFFIQKLKQIAAVVASFIDSIAAIASGQIAGAAKKVESTLVGMLTLAIAFLAKFAGLGNIPDKLVGIVRKIRAPIDRALDKIVAWLGGLLKKLIGAAKAAAKKLLNWWKKKVPVSGGDEQHTLTFAGSDKNATLVLRSAPELPSTFLAGAAQKRGVKDSDSKTPIGTAKTQEKAIGKTQTELKTVDENDKKAAAGQAMTAANTLMSTLDTQLQTLGAHIGITLTTWGVRDTETKPFTVPRGTFSVEQKRDIAAQHSKRTDLRRNADGEVINLRKGLARRHVVSSADMSAHYVDALVGKKWSEAKLLLEQRGSVGDSHTPVAGPLSHVAIAAAANQRYAKFFGYAKNLFIGDSKENSSIQQHLDDGNPEMAGQLLYNHVARIKRSWAIDGSIAITEVK